MAQAKLLKRLSHRSLHPLNPSLPQTNTPHLLRTPVSLLKVNLRVVDVSDVVETDVSTLSNWGAVRNSQGNVLQVLPGSRQLGVDQGTVEGCVRRIREGLDWKSLAVLSVPDHAQGTWLS